MELQDPNLVSIGLGWINPQIQSSPALKVNELEPLK